MAITSVIIPGIVGFAQAFISRARIVLEVDWMRFSSVMLLFALVVSAFALLAFAQGGFGVDAAPNLNQCCGGGFIILGAAGLAFALRLKK